MEDSEGEARMPAVRIWGPVQREQAVRSGALAAASSVLLAPVNGAAGLFDRLRARSSRMRFCLVRQTLRRHCVYASVG